MGVNKQSITSASLEFIQGDEKPAVATTFHGSYSIELRPGKYTVTVSAVGFCSRSGELLLGAGDHTPSLDFILIDCSDCDLRNIDLDSPVTLDEKSPQFPKIDLTKFKYQKEKLEGLPLIKPAPEIMFGEREERGLITVYRSLACPGWPQRKPVIFMYGPITLTAATLSYSKESHVVTAEGDVVLADEHETRRATTAELTIENGEFRISNPK